MKPTRTILLLLSLAVVVFLLGGGLAVKVGAGENSYRQVVVFSEILSLVMDNYVDPVDAQELLDGAYEGMLGGLDAHGAYLKPDEVQAEQLFRVITPMLFVQGSRARNCDLDVLRRTLARVGAPTALHTVENADHQFHVLKKSGRTREEVTEEILGTLDGWIQKVLGL